MITRPKVKINENSRQMSNPQNARRNTEEQKKLKEKHENFLSRSLVCRMPEMNFGPQIAMSKRASISAPDRVCAVAR
jgi:hypothetical protein